MATSAITVRIAQAAGLLGAAWLSGNIASLSIITIPALTSPQSRDYIPSTILARQWKSMFLAGKAQAPPIAAVTATSLSYLAWTLRTVPGNKAGLYGAAAVLTIGIVPWTLLAMNSTNQKLIAKADSTATVKGDEKEVQDLLKRWGTLNGIRSLLPLLGSAVAAVAILS